MNEVERKLQIAKMNRQELNAHVNHQDKEIFNLVSARDSAVRKSVEQAKEIERLKNHNEYLILDRKTYMDANLKKRRLEVKLQKQLELAVKALEQTDEVLRELYSQIGQDMDMNPSAKQVYLSKIAYAGVTVTRSTLEEIKRLGEGVNK